MPLLTTHIPGSTYGFSATRIEDLDACEYTLVGITADVSGSVSGFKAEIERCIRAAVAACARSPRADNLMLRVTQFDGAVDEVHGFRPLSASPLDDYDGCLRAGGLTALYDAAHNAVSAVTAYAKDLADSGLDTNALVVVITDGADNQSTLTAGSVKAAVRQAVQSESLESIRTVLVGVNVQDANLARYLADLRTSAGFDEYIELGDADADTLAALADFMSRAISAQSVALGSGSGSIRLTF